jgi:hypothetical protein
MLRFGLRSRNSHLFNELSKIAFMDVCKIVRPERQPRAVLDLAYEFRLSVALRQGFDTRTGKAGG